MDNKYKAMAAKYQDSEKGVCMSQGINCLNDSVLAQLLGADGIEELKTKIIDVIVNEIRCQLKGSSSYIISPDDIRTEIFGRIANDIYYEISAEYKKKISEMVDHKLSELKHVVLNAED